MARRPTTAGAKTRAERLVRANTLVGRVRRLPVTPELRERLKRWVERTARELRGK